MTCSAERERDKEREREKRIGMREGGGGGGESESSLQFIYHRPTTIYTCMLTECEWTNGHV